jgi:hypothetical protein
VLAALALGAVVGAVAVRLLLRDEFTLQTPHGWHFLYLKGLLAEGPAGLLSP